MLFDLEDYRSQGIIGPNHKPANQVNWVDRFTTSRATRDAYLKAINEYFLSVQVMCTPEEAQTLNVKMLAILDALTVLGPLSRQFWNAMISLPLADQLNVGDRFDVLDVNKYAEDTNYITYPNYSEQSWWTDNNKSVAIINAEGGEFTFTEMTQQLYDDHKAAVADFQLKLKELFIVSEGGVTNFNDYVVPAVPAWESYPELSGYVRGINNLTIKDAVVRLIDADGVNHDLITDQNGYYKFGKEMFYNNIAFDHGATASSFKMFLLENTFGSTASLYDKTSKFENSFWGAENNRGLNWEISVKMGKPARKNFKIDVVADYSMFPSIKGRVLDQNGNPVKDALMGFNYLSEGIYLDQKYNKNTGSWRSTSKFVEFGEEKSILTDENGNYEYSSQYIGDWFLNNILVSNPSHVGGLTQSPFDIISGFSIDEQFTFDSNGDPNGFDSYSQEWVNAAAEQADGKILIAANGDSSFNGSYTNKLFRINTDGSLDTTFTPQFSKNNSSPWVKSILLQADGKILVAGGFDYINDVEVHNIARLNSDGTLDTTFVDGVFSSIYNVDSIDYLTYYNLSFPMLAVQNPDMYVNAMELQADGKIIVGGYFYIPQINSYGIVRLNSDGSLDNTFMNSSNLLPSREPLIAAMVDLKSKITIAQTKEVEKDAKQPELDRLNSLVAMAFDYLQTLTPDDEGYAAADLEYNAKLADYNTYKDNVYNPALVASNNAWDDVANANSLQNQTVSDYFSPLQSNYVGQRSGGLGEDPKIIKVTTDGKILVGGSEWMNFGGYQGSLDEIGNYVSSPVGESFGLIRLNSDGTLDTTFSVGMAFKGTQPSGNNYPSAYIYSFVQLQDGKLLVAGDFNHYGDVSLSNQSLIRLNSDGTLDETAPQYQSANTGSWCPIFDVKMLSDGRILESTQYGIWILNTDGSAVLSADGCIGNMGGRSFLSLILSDGSIFTIGQFYGFIGTTKTDYNLSGMVKIKVGDIEKLRQESQLYNFDAYFSYNDGPLRSQSIMLNQNDFKVMLYPYTQDVVSGTVVKPWDQGHSNSETALADKIYDYEDWFNSRFEYAYNERGEYYIETILPGENIINAHEIVVDPELGAEKIYFTVENTNGNWDAIIFNSNTGYIRMVDDLGHKYMLSSGNWFDFAQYGLGENQSRNYYAYSCNQLGGAEGKINNINIQGNINITDMSELTGVESFQMSSNPLTTSIDLKSCSSTLNYVYINECNYLQDIDLTGCMLLNNLTLYWNRRLKLVKGVENASKLTNVTITGCPVATNTQLVPGEVMYSIPESTRSQYLSSKSRVDGQVNGYVEFPDGSSVYVGSFNWAYYTDDKTQQDFQYYAQRIVKFKADGSIDENFLNNIGNGFNNSPNGVELLPDGKILIYGDFDNFKNKNVGGMVKLSSTGVLDTSFTSKTKDKVYGVRNLMLLEDGSMLICTSGSSYNGPTTTGYSYCGIYKLKANGDLDQDFKMNLNSQVISIKKYGDSFFATGDFNQVSSGVNNTSIGSKIAKFDINGNTDTVFMSNTRDYYPTSTILDLQIDSMGRILIGGHFDTYLNLNTGSQTTAPRFGRFNSDGHFDLNFHNSLLVNNELMYLNGQVSCINIESNGNIVLYGSFNQLNGRDLGQRRFVTIGSNGLDTVYTPELGYTDSNIYKIVKGENYTVVLGYFWTYWTSTGKRYETTPMMVKFVETQKEISTFSLPSTESSLQVNLNYFYSNLNITSTDKLNYFYASECSFTSLDFSNSLNIYNINVNSCTSLTSLILGSPNNLNDLTISNCTSLDISGVNISVVKNQLNLSNTNFGSSNFTLNSSQIRRLYLTNSRGANLIINSSSMDFLYLENLSFSQYTINTPNLKRFYQYGNMSGIDVTLFTNLTYLYLYNTGDLPNLTNLTKLEELTIDRLQWTAIDISSNTIKRLNITSWNYNNKNISISASELTYLRLYGFYQQPNFVNINTPKLTTLQLDWCNQTISSIEFSKFSGIKELFLQNYSSTSEIDLSSLTSLEYFQGYWLNQLTSLIMPSGTTNKLKTFRLEYSPWNSNVTNTQRTAMIGSALAGLVKSTWNNGYAYFYADRSWTLDSTGVSNKNTLRNSKYWNVQGNLNN